MQSKGIFLYFVGSYKGKNFFIQYLTDIVGYWVKCCGWNSRKDNILIINNFGVPEAKMVVMEFDASDK